MASFVMHHTSGVELINKLSREYGIKIGEENIYNFLLGNLIVDSSNLKLTIPSGLNNEEVSLIKKTYQKKVQEEKISTHFRDNGDIDLCIQVPNVGKFLQKYNNLVSSDFSALGYLFHLYTDKMFFEYLFDKTFECLDNEKNKTVYAGELRFIKILKNNNLVSAEDFFNGEKSESIYNDYTVMNKLVLMHFQILFDASKMQGHINDFINPGIEEVNYQNITSVINKTNIFIRESYEVENNALNVFKEEDVYNFIEYISNKFLDEYRDVIVKLINSTIANKDVKVKVKTPN